MTIGKLRHRITIRRPQEVSNGHGGYATVWTTIATPWADATSLGGREAVIGEALQGIAVFRFRIRWRDDIRASDQVRHDGVDLNITAPPADPDGRRRWLVFTAASESVRS